MLAKRYSLGLKSATLLASFIAVCAQACVNLTERPELRPDDWAPASANRLWQIPVSARDRIRIPQTEIVTGSSGPQRIQPNHEYDLPELIDVALMNNPETLRAWSSARSAAARFGRSQAAYYPRVTWFSDSGEERMVFELPGHAGTLKQWQVDPIVTMNWTLLDFGRRQAASEASLDRLIAANLNFNRTLQDVVFNTEVAFYALDAANAAVLAAQENLKLAETDFEAVSQRVNLGLATEPQLLLAKQTVAQSQFDVANSQLMVRDAQAQMAVALGIAPTSPLRIKGLETLAVPQQLDRSVEMLIAEARRQRPDLAARVASLHASEADVRHARARLLPVVGASAGYGANFWNFTFSTPRTVQTVRPQYSALVTLRWDIFTGFGRLNDLRRIEDDRDAARAALRSAEIETIAQVWRAYFDLDLSRSRYAYAQSLLVASRASHEANLETYRQGLSTIIELLTAERDLANARYALIQSKAQLLTAYATLAYAAGTLHVKQ